MTRPSSAHTRSLPLVLAVVAASIFVGGCTQRQDPADYSDTLAKTLSARNDVVQQLDGGKLQSVSAYATAQKQIQDSLDQLDSQPPPKKYEKGHDHMVDALDGLGVLLGKLQRCQALQQSSMQDARACRQSIGQDVFDTLRNDFAESDAIYRQEGLSLSQLSDGGSDDQAGSNGGDVLSGS